MNNYKKRFILVFVLLVIILVVIIARVIDLTEVQSHFLKARGEHEAIHYRKLPAYRGIIYDRNHIPLAVTAPIDNIIFDPKVMLKNKNYWQELASNDTLGLTETQITLMVDAHPNLQFLYAKKLVPPSLADTITALHIPGVYAETENASFYPDGEATAQLVGFTNAKNQGQDGLELAYNNQLKAKQGLEEVVLSGHGHILSIPKVLKAPQNGQSITLSIDSRIQFVAYQAVKYEVEKVKADSGSVVVLNPKNGEVLAAVSYPDFNPNNIHDRYGKGVRDRAITDVFEPGSTMKVFTISTALTSGKYTPTTPIDTSPGYYFINGFRIKDDADFGKINVTKVLEKSSNVGASKIALSLPHKSVYDMFKSAGFSKNPGGIFPAEATGIMPPLANLGTFEYATMSFGYALSASVLQIARAYAAIANGGVIYPISFLKLKHKPKGTRIMPKKVAQELLNMLHTVVSYQGTGFLANIPGYNVVGKTGTTHKVGPHGFYRNQYNALFAGIAPMKDPRLVIIVHINDPHKGLLSGLGGASAAPVFAKIAAASLRILGVPMTKQHIDQDLFREEKSFMRLVADA